MSMTTDDSKIPQLLRSLKTAEEELRSASQRFGEAARKEDSPRSHVDALKAALGDVRNRVDTLKTAIKQAGANSVTDAEVSVAESKTRAAKVAAKKADFIEQRKAAGATLKASEKEFDKHRAAMLLGEGSCAITPSELDKQRASIAAFDRDIELLTEAEAEAARQIVFAQEALETMRSKFRNDRAAEIWAEIESALAKLPFAELQAIREENGYREGKQLAIDAVMGERGFTFLTSESTVADAHLGPGNFSSLKFRTAVKTPAVERVAVEVKPVAKGILRSIMGVAS